MSDISFMALALQQAQISKSKDEVPIGAIIVKDNKVIAIAHNERESSNIATAHAEIIAIQKACTVLNTWRLTGCTMYVTLQPCMMCSGALVLSRIDRVVFGAYDQKRDNVDYFKNEQLNHYPEVLGGILLEECSTILSEYFKEKRK